jgi:hypothetical protein
MEIIEFHHLELRAPLYYLEASGLEPFETDEREEQVFCFELNGGEGSSIEPDLQHWLGPLLCAGRRRPISAGGEPGFEIPAGHYLFAQLRGKRNREDFIYMGTEVQKDGLWERYGLENRVFLRRLFEDGLPVTQVLRPCSPPKEF